MKYRMISKVSKDGEITYKLQESLLGIIWTKVKYVGYEPPHEDLMVPANCIVGCVFKNILNAEKCLKALLKK